MAKLNIEETKLPVEQVDERKKQKHTENLKVEVKKGVMTVSDKVTYIE